MAVIQCKMCGGTIEFEQGTTVGVCEHCGSKQTFPKLDSEMKSTLYERANQFRRNNEFDKAIAIYVQILNEDNTDAEAYWSLVICRYGIEYVEDPSTRKRIPTVKRAQFSSIFDDDNYKSAIQYADSMQRIVYEAEARVINEIQKGIFAVSEKENASSQRQAELRVIEQQKKRKKAAAITGFLGAFAVLAVAGVLLTTKYFIPHSKYREAIRQYNDGQYLDSFHTFESVADFKDSCELMKEANYQYAVTLYNESKFEEAIEAFNYAPEYEDAQNQILACENGIKDIAYDSAVTLYNEKKYEDAISEFEELDGYRDSADQIQKCKDGISEEAYVAAVKLFDGKEYQKASDAFGKIDESYKDVKDKIKQCSDALLDIDYQQGISYLENKEFDKAIALFEKTGDYSDSKAQVLECKYQQALAKYESKEYESAQTMFTQLGDYKESKSYVTKCEDKLHPKPTISASIKTSYYEDREGSKIVLHVSGNFDYYTVKYVEAGCGDPSVTHKDTGYGKGDLVLQHDGERYIESATITPYFNDGTSGKTIKVNG